MANKTSPGRVAQSTSYKNSKRWERNRRKKLQKLLEKHPNNKQIEAALNNIVYRRKTPANPFWSSTRKRLAYLFKLYKGVVHQEIFSNNEKVSLPALLLQGPYSMVKFPNANEKTMFQLSTRVRYKQ